jgi:hypothetical protein
MAIVADGLDHDIFVRQIAINAETFNEKLISAMSRYLLGSEAGTENTGLRLFGLPYRGMKNLSRMRSPMIPPKDSITDDNVKESLLHILEYETGDEGIFSFKANLAAEIWGHIPESDEKAREFVQITKQLLHEMIDAEKIVVDEDGHGNGDSDGSAASLSS